MGMEWFTNILEGIGGKGNAGNTAAALGLGTAGLALAEKGYSDIGDIGREAYEGLAGEQGLAQELRGMMEFQPYTVTSATGGQFGMMQDPATGQMSYQLTASPEEQALQQQALTDASMFFGQAAAPIAQREQDVYNRMRAAMSPEEERQRLALEQRMAAQGRTGVRTAQFGGTPEQLTLAKAQEEARNSAMLNAMQFAGQEQQRQSQLGTGMLAAGYVPQAQLLNALQPGMSASERQRQAMSEQAKSYGQTYTTGLEALLQSGLGQANLAGGFGSSIASSALGGLFS
tara:strand:+ start:903 stop:1763 length:861 start_codon:yes stop_codon:yes gene_type:complete